MQGCENSILEIKSYQKNSLTYSLENTNQQKVRDVIGGIQKLCRQEGVGGWSVKCLL